jgi:hypothetical protein
MMITKIQKLTGGETMTLFSGDGTGDRRAFVINPER